MTLKIKNHILSPESRLPKIIEDPEDLIKKITRKVSINIKATNLNTTFSWINLAQQTLKRYSNFDEKLVLVLQYNLANVLIDKHDYSKAKILLKDTIKRYKKYNKSEKKKISKCYYYLAMSLRHLGEYENARISIVQAMEGKNNIYNYYCEYANIMFYLDKIDEAEDIFKKALDICIAKKGNTHPATASIISHYGYFLGSLGRINKAKEYMNNAYQIFKKELGENNLYTVRITGHISNILYAEKKYNESYEKMVYVFINTNRILGNKNEETLICKYNCAKMLIKMKQYSKALDYLENPFVIIDKNETSVLLSYNKKIMIAPEVFIIKLGSSAVKILKIMENNNIPIAENCEIVRIISKECKQFEPIPQILYCNIAKIIHKLNLYI